jgi:hypothetical protein
MGWRSGPTFQRFCAALVGALQCTRTRPLILGLIRAAEQIVRV